MRKPILLFLLLVFVLFMVSCELFQQPTTPEPTATPTATQEGNGGPPPDDGEETATATATQESPDNGATVTPSPTQESDDGSDGEPGDEPEDEQPAPAPELMIDNPAEGDVVFSPATISGTVSQMPFESQLTAQVLDADGGIISEGVIMASPDDDTELEGSGTFSGTLEFAVDAVVDGGMIRVFEETAGSEESTVVMSDTVSVTLAPEGITIVEPAEGDTVFTPVQVRGYVSTRPFEATLRGRVYDGNGTVVGEGPIMVTPVGDQIWGPGTFDATIPFTISVAGPGVVEVADLSAQDGSIIVSDTVDVVLAIGPK